MAFPRRFAQLPVAVIGADGFLGRRLVAALARDGAPVATFTRVRRFCDGAGRPAPGLRAARTVFHLATSVDIALAEHRPDLLTADHQTFLHLLDALERCEHRTTLVLPSSGEWLYDPTGRPPYRENAPVRPTNAFGTAKLRLERELLRRVGAVRPVILRLATPYGPGRRTPQVPELPRSWPENAATGHPPRIDLDGDARDYVYVDDVVDAMTRLSTRTGLGSPARILNIGSGVPTPPGRLAATAADTLPDSAVTVPREATPYPGRRDSWLDVTAAADALDWRATTPLSAGLRRTWARPAVPARLPAPAR